MFSVEQSQIVSFSRSRAVVFTCQLCDMSVYVCVPVLVFVSIFVCFGVLAETFLIDVRLPVYDPPPT